jgi:hypothetical protein
MEWAFNVNTFWPAYLVRVEDPVGYFLSKLPRIDPQFKGWKMSRQNQDANNTEGDQHHAYRSTAARKPRTITAKQAPDNRAAADAAKHLVRDRAGAVASGNDHR